jgi:hypothetical protein
MKTCPRQPSAPALTELPHRLVAGLGHAGADAQVLGLDEEPRDRPMPPALLRAGPDWTSVIVPIAALPE